ncbi:hypothetical protein OB13_20520, partial [Pontibacter sp. HJ8]
RCGDRFWVYITQDSHDIILLSRQVKLPEEFLVAIKQEPIGNNDVHTGFLPVVTEGFNAYFVF